jgi:catechol 2,3-dioxygenase-like lactoylglutathione lyase family enzyme
MAKIRHLAIITLDPEALSKFYEEVFKMRVLQRLKSGAITMTDGYLTVALLNNKAEGKPSGLNHFGFHVEDMEETAERLRIHGVAAPVKRPEDRVYAEYRATDPDGNNFDLSVHGYETAETWEDRKKKEPVLAD